MLTLLLHKQMEQILQIKSFNILRDNMLRGLSENVRQNLSRKQQTLLLAVRIFQHLMDICVHCHVGMFTIQE